MKQRVFHRRTDEHAASSAGFTMVELAVVIAMTAILTALLLPALSGAKEKSRRAVCRSNLKQLYIVCMNYSGDNNDVLPSAADNDGNYHSIRLSDQIFTNLVENYAGGTSNIFYCPNLVFNSGPNGFTNYHDKYGYVIGYSYLASDVPPASSKGADSGALTPVKMTPAVQTNVLLADANYWSPTQYGYSPSFRMAPHTATGAAMAGISSSATTPAATNSASLGAAGGNIELFNYSVYWRNIDSMQTRPVSSAGDAWGNW
jgi:type II secretory pathway pseudopilin PulG